ncbi:hypothetical protein B0J12DRAFT_673753, partial [Macrophomina phaseolina]
MLKDFGRAVVDDLLILTEFHFMLPPLLRFQNDFAAAMALLKGPLANYHAKPDHLSQKLLLEQAAQHLKPKVGVKIGRPTWYKARSIKNCLQMVGDGTWVIERKYDGEFCEIHVDLDREDEIQIFSKNGKDATQDRKNLIPAIRDSLKIGTPGCQFRSQCILLGEMVVFNQLQNDVADFDKIRKHVSRSGSFLGTDRDSQPHPYENLMIYYFDILLVDDEVTMALPHNRRRKRLSQIITKIDGRAKSVEWKVLDFSEGEAKKSLIYQFSVALTSRCEGLILKPNAAFFSLMGNHTGGWCKGFIKLKKDYMTDMGGARDVADFAVVAASYDVHEAQKSRFQNVRWTNFYLGCLVDDDDCYQQKPTFKIVTIVKASHCIPPKELEFLNQIGQFHGKNFDIDESLEQFTVIIGKNPQPTFVFTDPLVVEVLGSNFEKPHNENFYMLRHPRILRIHMDRSWEDCITMQGLADMAREAKEAPLEGGSQEARDQVSRFMEKINRARDQDRSSLVSRQTTPRSAGTAMSPLATLKSVAPDDVFYTPVRAPPLRNFSATSTASTKTPSPATALIRARRTTGRNSAVADFTKEVSPLSQPSTQWTETTVTPIASAKRSLRQLQPTISPPKRKIGVSDRVISEEVTLTTATEPRTRGSSEGSPCPGGQNTTRLRSARLDPSGQAGTEDILFVVGGPAIAKNVSIDCEDEAEEELSFYEEREALSMRQQCSELKKQQSKTVNSCRTIHSSIHSTPLMAIPTTLRRRHSSAKGLTSEASPKDLRNLFSQQMKDAEYILVKEHAFKVRDSTRTGAELGEIMAEQPMPEAAAPAQPYALPPIPYVYYHLMHTPPKSSPNEPLSANNVQPPAPARLPNSPPTSYPPPTTAISPTNTTPIKTSRRILKRPRAADDFDIGASPRKIPKWRSPVYGLPRLSLHPLPPAAAPAPSVPAFRPNSNNHTRKQLLPPSSLDLPYDLSATCIYVAPSLQHHTRLTHSLLTQHFTVGALVFDLEDWRRGDGVVYESMGSTVGESQAFCGMRKVCLVEKGKEEEWKEVVMWVEDVLRGAGRAREEVGIFDWRVMEDLVEGEGRESGVWERRFCAVA